MKRRLKALKKLQFQMIEIESKFYEEVHELECKYAAKYAPLFDRVCIIIMYFRRVDLKLNIFIADVELKHAGEPRTARPSEDLNHLAVIHLGL